MCMCFAVRCVLRSVMCDVCVCVVCMCVDVWCDMVCVMCDVRVCVVGRCVDGCGGCVWGGWGVGVGVGGGGGGGVGAGGGVGEGRGWCGWVELSVCMTAEGLRQTVW